MDKNNENRNENLSFVTDEDALTEIDLGSFLDETSKPAPVFEDFHDDIQKTEKNFESELQNLYDDIMNSGPATIVPKPLSVITAEETSPAESGLSEMWMNPEEYIDIPVVSLDESEEEDFAPEEAFFKPEPANENEAASAAFSADSAKDDIFGLIDSMKSETDGDAGFSNILAEIEANSEILPLSNDYAAIDDFLKTLPVIETEETAPVFEEAPAEEVVPEEEQLAVSESTEAEIASEEVADSAEAEEEPINTNSEEFERTLAALLSDDPIVPEQVSEEADNSFVVNVPDDGNDYSFASDQNDEPVVPPTPFFDVAESYEQPLTEQPDRVVIGDFEAAQKAALEADAADTKEARKERKKREKEEKKNGEKKPVTKGEVVRRIVLTLSFVVMFVCALVLVNTYIIQPEIAKKVISESISELAEGEKKYGDSVVDDSVRDEYNVEFPDGMLAKYSQLYATNSDLRGWISIPAFEMNLPIVQGSNNEYYLKRNIYKKWVSYGVPFFDYRIEEDQFKTLPRNTVIYGHNMRSDDLIFGMLEEYRDIDGYKRAPVIECNTIYGDYTWLVCGVFISNSDPKDDNGYVFPYNFIDCSDQLFAEYIVELEKRSFYDTGVDLAVTDKILTLSTCCYDFNNARLVVVARLLREGESVSVDTSKAVKNPDPKGPQAWYDELGKPNNHASDARWYY